MEKEAREEALDQSKQGKFRVLISFDITARGIDIQQVSIVINFDIIRDINTYLHAIGRLRRYYLVLENNWFMTVIRNTKL